MYGIMKVSYWEEWRSLKGGVGMTNDARLNPGCCGRMYDADKMFVYVKGRLAGAKMNEAVKALNYMREAHKKSNPRKDGQPYEIHPLMMECLALSFDNPYITEATHATILLHDVPEEEESAVSLLPFSDEIKRGVKYMTITKFKNETDFEKKKRYMNELLESRDAVIGKAIDRYVNLSTMPGSFPDDKVRKNIVETDMLLLPVLREAKYKYSEITSLLYILRNMVRNTNDTLAIKYGVKLTDPEFVNAPGAKDYSYLLTG